jgi:hypothetical protein
VYCQSEDNVSDCLNKALAYFVSERVVWAGNVEVMSCEAGEKGKCSRSMECKSMHACLKISRISCSRNDLEFCTQLA